MKKPIDLNVLATSLSHSGIRKKGGTRLDVQTNEFVYNNWGKEIKDNDRYLDIPILSEMEEKEIRLEFINGQKNESLKKTILGALSDSNFFHDFHIQTIEYDLDEAWEEFEEKTFLNMARQWCEHHGLECSDNPMTQQEMTLAFENAQKLTKEFSEKPKEEQNLIMKRMRER